MKNYKFLTIVIFFFIPTITIYSLHFRYGYYINVLQFLYIIPIILSSYLFGISAGIACSFVVFLLYVPSIMVNLASDKLLQAQETIIGILLTTFIGNITGINILKNKREALKFSLLSYIYQEGLSSYTKSDNFISSMLSKIEQYFPIKIKNDIILVEKINSNEIVEYLSSVVEIINSFIKKYELHQRAENLKNFIQISLDEINYGIMVLDTDGKITFANKYLKSIVGDETIDKYYVDCLDVSFSEKIKEIISILQNKNHYEDKYLFGNFSFLIDALKIYNDENKVIGTIFTLENIKDKEKMITTKEMNKLMSIFAKSISYEAKMSFSVIFGFISTLLSDDFDEKTKAEFYNIIYLEAERLTKLVNNVLYFSKIEANKKITLNQEEINISSLVYDEVSFIKNWVTSCNFKLNLQDNIKILADKEKLQLAIYNILSNTMKFSCPGKDIIVSVDDKDNFILLSVENDGYGIPQKEKDKIFCPLYSNEKNIKNPTKDIGIGMYLAKYFIELHKGNIYFESEEGKKTKFYFKLPKGE